MKITLTTFITSAMLAMPLVSATITPSSAKAVVTAQKINSEGFRKCKSLGGNGFTAVIRGESTYTTNSRGGLGRFNIRTCFNTKAQCKSFVNGGISKVLIGISSISHKSCRSRNS